MWIAPLWIAGLAAPSPVPPPAVAPAVSAPEGTIAEDVETMRLLLVDAAAKALAGDETSTFKAEHPATSQLANEVLYAYAAGVRSLTAASSRVGGSRGFHVPGTGVVYTLDATLPMRPAKSAEAKGETDGKAADDAWSRAQRRARGEDVRAQWSYLVAQGAAATTVALEIDEEAIGRLTDAILETLARYGGRIEGLGAGESLTVCVRLEGSGAGLQTTNATSDAAQAWVLSGVSTQAHRAESLVLQIPGDLPAALSGKPFDASDVRPRALVHRYAR